MCECAFVYVWITGIRVLLSVAWIRICNQASVNQGSDVNLKKKAKCLIDGCVKRTAANAQTHENIMGLGNRNSEVTPI